MTQTALDCLIQGDKVVSINMITQGAALAAHQATGRLQTVPPSASGGRPCAILPDWYADCSHR